MIHLIEIFDTITGDTLFYIRMYDNQQIIENYIESNYPNLKNWDYEVKI